VDKRRLLLVTQSLMLLQATLLALAVSSGVVQPWMILALALAHGCINTFDLPARQSFVIEMTGREDLTNGIALNSAAFNTARIVGPSIAGLVLASLGEAACFWLNAVSFLAVIVALRAAAAGEAARDARSARRWSIASPGARGRCATAAPLAVCAGLGFQYNVLPPVYARDLLRPARRSRRAARLVRRARCSRRCA
jgi:MFS family permease